jgi:hypothetical protein
VWRGSAAQPRALSAARCRAGVVRSVQADAPGGCSAEVELLDTGTRHVMREAQLETVLPKPGGKARRRTPRAALAYCTLRTLP